MGLTMSHPGVLVGLMLGLLILLSAACGSEVKEVVVQLAEQGSSAQSGTATLTASGDQTEVVIRVTAGSLEIDPQPVHIHFGGCGIDLGNVHYTLNDVVAGESTTQVDASLASIRDDNNTVNLHLSYSDIRTYTACGNVPTG